MIHGSIIRAEAAAFDEAESYAILGSEDVSRNDSNGFLKENITLKSLSFIRRELIDDHQSILGWPLLSRTRPQDQQFLRRSKARSMSLIEWVMSLPTRSYKLVLQNQMESISNEVKNGSCNSKIDNFVDEDCENQETVIHLIEISRSKLMDGSSSNGEDEMFGSAQDVSSSSCSVVTEEDSEQSKFGWPLLRIKPSATLVSSMGPETRELSVVKPIYKEAESFVEKDVSFIEDNHCKTCLESPRKLEFLAKLKSSECNLFSYEELKIATQQFSSANLIGEGGCSNVYKGHLSSGKLVAVKVLKQYKEARNDFSLEVDIMSSLKHRHITPLIGVCNEDDSLILVYDFLTNGSLEESLQGHGQKSVLPWKLRFKVAIAIAEALNYLHSECSQPVIHRDVKSSNILLSRDYEPQLSDFGLAIWGPADSTYMIVSDIVGTFGYIAPEYFTYGRISDKNDVYSFGIVLLELLTGRRPINSNGTKAEKSLAKWATLLIKRGNLKALLDSKLGGDFSIVEVHRMVLAATLCVKQTAMLRPKMSQILKLLKGEENEREWIFSYAIALKESSDKDIDELLPEFGRDPSMKFSFLDLDDCAASLPNTKLQRNAEQKIRLTLKDYLKERQD